MTQLHDAVFSRAAATPDAVALMAGGKPLTYRELVDRARGLAVRLRAEGVRTETKVGVLADRSADSVVAFLGVLAAGGAYVPIAADQPAARLRTIVQDAGIAVVTGVRAPAGISAVFVPVDGPPWAGEPLPSGDPGQAAYVIFTSGSTGKPKGVVVPHVAAAASTTARFDVYPHEDLTYLVCAPLTIDAAVAGLYFTLHAGGRVVLPTDEESADPQSLAELVEQERVTHLDGLPSQYWALLESHWESLRELRCVVLGGDSLPHPLARRHLKLLPDVALFNEYGPTEGTVWCTAHRCNSADEGPRVPIGRPIPGMRVTVLTSDLYPVPPGEVGEICISGAGVARGYLGRPGTTAERFVPDPVVPGERMYRTGDLGSIEPNGEIVFHGRADNLVKVRGFRVELEEVEARLRQHPDVADAVVVPRTTATGVRLVAVLALVAGHSANVRELATFTLGSLPGYMVPTVWRQVDALPVAANGKVDRISLTSAVMTAGTALAR
jgi:amino acid adenylation domain-containing protein